jgi:hypothetical protein
LQRVQICAAGSLLVELPKAKIVEDLENFLPWRLATAER